MLPTMTGRTPSGTRQLSTLRDEMDRLFEDLMRTPARSRQGTVLRPAANIVETEKNYEIELELPGFDREDITVTVEQGVLTVSGQRPSEREASDRTYHLRERSTGRFSRSFSLPSSVDPDQVSARFEDGVLNIDLPKQEKARTRKIEVDVS